MYALHSGHFSRQLQRPAGLRENAHRVWLTSSVDIVAGALGSGLGSEDAARRATYGAREVERRSRDGERREDSRSEAGAR